MQEQEGGRWGVGEKNKRRIGGEGRELKRKRKRVRRVTPLRKGRKEYRHERERERERGGNGWKFRISSISEGIRV